MPTRSHLPLITAGEQCRGYPSGPQVSMCSVPCLSVQNMSAQQTCSSTPDLRWTWHRWCMLLVGERPMLFHINSHVLKIRKGQQVTGKLVGKEMSGWGWGLSSPQDGLLGYKEEKQWIEHTIGTGVPVCEVVIPCHLSVSPMTFLCKRETTWDNQYRKASSWPEHKLRREWLVSGLEKVGCKANETWATSVSVSNLRQHIQGKTLSAGFHLCIYL